MSELTLEPQAVVERTHDLPSQAVLFPCECLHSVEGACFEIDGTPCIEPSYWRVALTVISTITYLCGECKHRAQELNILVHAERLS